MYYDDILVTITIVSAYVLAFIGIYYFAKYMQKNGMTLEQQYLNSEPNHPLKKEANRIVWILALLCIILAIKKF